MNEETVPDLYRLAFIPGCFKCPKCDFRLTKQTLAVNLGLVGVSEADRESEECPNDGTMMVHVTYREQLSDYADRLKEELDNADILNKSIRNISMVARRQIRRAGQTEKLVWGHILRFCEEAGCKPNILREEVTCNIPAKP